MIPSRGGYVLDRHDEKESTQKKGSIGFVVDLGDEYQPDMAVNPIYESIMQNIDAQVVNWGNHLLTTYICYRKETGKERFTGLLKKVDGLFITGLINPDLLKELQTLSTPVVSLFSNLDVDTIDEIGLNSEKTYYEIVKRIIDMGHNTIAYLDGPKIYYQKARRISGCTQAVNEHPADGVSFTEICAEGWSSEAARSATEKLLKSKPRIDVIVAVNDILATGALRACQDSGFRVPEDISVVGAKNTILSISSNPQLTTVDYHFGEIAKIAAERMMNRINSKACIPVKIEVIGTLVERQSTKNKRKNTKG
jgi:LacI family transcriptional regulator